MTATAFADPTGQPAATLIPVTASSLPPWLDGQPGHVKDWLDAVGFKAEAGSLQPLPDGGGGLAAYLVGVSEQRDVWALAALPRRLPEGVYRLEMAAPGAPDAADATNLCLGWGLGAYRFDRYKAADRRAARLIWPDGVDRAAVTSQTEAIRLVRDLINTPACDMGPAELADAAQELAARHGGACRTIVGEALLAQNYPTIHAVGRASARPPRLIDLTWGAADAPKLTLVGKGVCFDSGGLDLKPSGNMLIMKKDMGGAAHMLGLAAMIMGRGLPLRLRVLIPAVENAVSGDAFRPMDILKTRKGLTVEVGNTDAEGRLVLCDALAEASDENPDMIIDYATLTGAARVALGPDVPAFFSNNDDLATELAEASERTADPVWRLPLHQPYGKLLATPNADTGNVSSGPYGGAITAALFLEKFVTCPSWIHVDVMAWNPADRPGRPKGGEAQGLRAMYEMIERRFGDR